MSTAGDTANQTVSRVPIRFSGEVTSTRLCDKARGFDPGSLALHQPPTQGLCGQVEQGSSRLLVSCWDPRAGGKGSSRCAHAAVLTRQQRRRRARGLTSIVAGPAALGAQQHQRGPHATRHPGRLKGTGALRYSGAQRLATGVRPRANARSFASTG